MEAVVPPLRFSLGVLALSVLGGCLDFDPARYFRDEGRAGTDPSCARRCVAPEPSCKDPSTRITARLRACDDQTCEFLSLETRCDQGCVDGSCVTQPCAGVFCEGAPAATCLDATTLRAFVRPGTCSGAAICTFSTVDLSCPQGCASGSCVSAPCLGVQCLTPPPSRCVGSTLRTYDAPGVCSNATADCAYAPRDTPCAFGCEGNACVTQPCAGVSCSSPPATTCADDTSLRVLAPSGTCSAGVCSHLASTQACAPGTRCEQGRCVAPAADCSASTCSGCCNGNACVPPASQAPAQCGLNGNACVACGAGFGCNAGQCSDLDECLVANGGCSANANCTNVPGGRTCSCRAGFSGNGLSCTPTGAGGGAGGAGGGGAGGTGGGAALGDGGTGAADGLPCDVDSQCAGGLCLTEARFGHPRGQCSNAAPCQLGTNVGCNGGVCQQGGSMYRCAARCTGTGLGATGRCRAGYACRDDGIGTAGVNWCSPVCASDSECQGAGGGLGCNPWSKLCGIKDSGKLKYGAPCTEDAQCESVFCTTGAQWPRGACVGLARADTRSCAPDGRFVSTGAANVGVCFDACTNNSQCTQGAPYECAPQNYCRCRLPGSSCMSGLYCCSGSCGGGTCL